MNANTTDLRCPWMKRREYNDVSVLPNWMIESISKVEEMNNSLT